MRNLLTLLTASIFLVLPVSCSKQKNYSDYPISMVNIGNVELTDSFWLPKIKTIQDITINYAFEKCISEGRLENFLIAGGKKPGKTLGKMPFDDSDIYKIIEGASNSLISSPNKKLDSYLDSVIAIIKIGQEADGYLTTWITIDPNSPPAPWVEKTGQRWTREISSHELYNIGHMFEAAVTHYLATGKRNFLGIAIKNADLLVNTFGPGKVTLPPGHQIIETGLVKLYRVTQNEKYLELAKYFLDIRGDSTTHKLYGEYNQDHKPVVQQTEIVGHAVRAVYMYAGMTDIAAIYNDTSYLNAVKNIWQNMIESKIYITGGIGAKHEGESLGRDYELPNLTAYAETCAAIGNVYWNNRLFMLTGDSKYYDIIERSMYNGLISGISSDGTMFFYVNPLESDGKFRFNQGSCTREHWFDCSCCPTNLIRFIPSIPGLIYSTSGDSLYINLYASNKASIQFNQFSVKIEQITDYPWQGNIKIRVSTVQEKQFTLKLRLPGWTQNKPLPSDLYSYNNDGNEKVVIRINGKETEYETKLGYALITKKWKKNDVVEMELPMKIHKVIANKKVIDDRNLAALEYGPFVYCFEGFDVNVFDKLSLLDISKLHVEKKKDFLGSVNVITGFLPMSNSKTAQQVTSIPYYTWSNRGESLMKVWIPLN